MPPERLSWNLIRSGTSNEAITEGGDFSRDIRSISENEAVLTITSLFKRLRTSLASWELSVEITTSKGLQSL